MLACTPFIIYESVIYLLIEVLGCKVNQYDARQIARLFEGFGLREAGRDSADIVVVHTCGVTSTAVQKCRQAMRRLKRKNPKAIAFLTGCAAESGVIGEMGEVNARISAGRGWIKKLADELQCFSLPNPDYCLPDNPDEMAAETFGKHTRAFLKVQDGCNGQCAYCIVPQLRKSPRDKSLKNIVSEAKALVKRDYKEIVITGVHVGLYGREGGSSLPEILEMVACIPGMGRIRMSSLHPNELTDELLSVWKRFPNIMPHIHLSLQSGSDGVLKRMRRGYSAGEYKDAVNRARAVLNSPAITTDVIVGFPSESNEEFNESYEFCKEICFAGMHIFSYSSRPGTVAAEMPDQIDSQTAHSRHQRLADLADEMSLLFNESFIGKKVNVLVERCKNGMCSGGCEHYINVAFLGEEELCGKIVPVMVKSANKKCLNASLLGGNN